MFGLSRVIWEETKEGEVTGSGKTTYTLQAEAGEDTDRDSVGPDVRHPAQQGQAYWSHQENKERVRRGQRKRGVGATYPGRIPFCRH